MTQAPSLRGADLAKVTSRSLYLQALFTSERQQGPGFAFALLPVIRRLYPGSEDRGRALGRHLGFFGTHPVLAGYVLGVAARLEERRAQGGPVDEDGIERAKRSLASPLAALGDPLFWVTLRPLAGLVGILGMAFLPPADPSGPDPRVLVCPLLALLTYNAVALPFRVAGVPRGYALADDPVTLLRSLKLAGWKQVLDRVGAFGYGTLAALVLAAMSGSVDPLGRGPAHVASVLAPFVLGAVGAAAGLKRWPGRGVEIALAALLLALIVSTRV
ncbi:MAG: PTS system mannose/fructose/sorbose family transporter subunit IID [Candidatus Latescibacteria bacterium]|nr:PTS system mannose/fructose/sorbose family transporter subunit IID [Candidatus Latescibacterota bacterium]